MPPSYSLTIIHATTTFSPTSDKRTHTHVTTNNAYTKHSKKASPSTIAQYLSTDTFSSLQYFSLFPYPNQRHVYPTHTRVRLRELPVHPAVTGLIPVLFLTEPTPDTSISNRHKNSAISSWHLTATRGCSNGPQLQLYPNTYPAHTLLSCARTQNHSLARSCFGDSKIKLNWY